MCLSNFKAIRQFKVPISCLRDFTRSYEKTSFRILRRGPGYNVRDTRSKDDVMTWKRFPYHWPLGGEPTSYPWISLAKGHCREALIFPLKNDVNNVSVSNLLDKKTTLIWCRCNGQRVKFCVQIGWFTKIWWSNVQPRYNGNAIMSHPLWPLEAQLRNELVCIVHRSPVVTANWSRPIELEIKFCLLWSLSVTAVSS